MGDDLDERTFEFLNLIGEGRLMNERGRMLFDFLSAHLPPLGEDALIELFENEKRILFRSDGKLSESGLRLAGELVKHLPEMWGSAYKPLKENVGVQENIELIIFRDGYTLWAWREDPDFRGWHVPGTNRRPREVYQVGATRCAKRELGCDVQVIEAMAPVDHPDSPRFHEAVVLLRCELVGQPTTPMAGEVPKAGELRWFGECPEDAVIFQRRYWPHIEKHLRS